MYGEASIPAAAGRREASIRIPTKTQLPKDRNCEVWRTKITRVPCRTRISNHIPRAEKVRDLTTADHKVLKEDCELRNSHRYVVIVPDSATQLLQTDSGKTKTSHETEKSSRKLLEPNDNYTDNSLEFGKVCEELLWNHCTSFPHRSETNGIAERAVRQVKEGTLAILLQSGLDENWWAHSKECATAIYQHPSPLIGRENTS